MRTRIALNAGISFVSGHLLVVIIVLRSVGDTELTTLCIVSFAAFRCKSFIKCVPVLIKLTISKTTEISVWSPKLCSLMCERIDTDFALASKLESHDRKS